MPVIVTKKMSLSVQYLQGRRINCEHCSHPFTYVMSGWDAFQVVGVPVLSADEQMRKNLAKAASSGLRVHARRARKGKATCPHCHRFQKWMTTVPFGKGLAALAVVPVLPLAWWWLRDTFMETGRPAFVGPLIGRDGAVIGVLLVVGFVTMGVLLRVFREGVGPFPDEDRRSLTDEQLRLHVSSARTAGQDPLAGWYFGATGEKPRDRVFSLGIDDFTKAPILPPEWGSEHALARMEGTAA